MCPFSSSIFRLLILSSEINNVYFIILVRRIFLIKQNILVRTLRLILRSYALYTHTHTSRTHILYSRLVQDAYFVYEIRIVDLIIWRLNSSIFASFLSRFSFSRILTHPQSNNNIKGTCIRYPS